MSSRVFAVRPLAFIACVACFGLIAGCSGEKSGGGDTAKQAPAQKAAAEADEKAAKKAAKEAEKQAEGGVTFRTGKREFVFAIQGEPETLDPGIMRGVHEAKVGDAIFEGLMEFPKGAGEPEPGVAERYELSEDGRTYTFYLRKNAKWSNGDPVTANDFVYSWRRVIDPNTASPYAEQLWIIEGARDITEGKSKDWDTVAIKAIDDYTFQVRLAYVAPYFIQLSAFHTYRPVHKATVEKHGDTWTAPGKIVSNGPYKLVERVQNKHIKLDKNPHYWGADQLGIDTVTVLPIEDNTAALNVFESGKMDWTGSINLPAIKLPALSQTKEYHQDPYLGAYFYRFNVKHPVLKDAKVRRALALAIDREAVMTVIKGGNEAATNYVPKMPGYTAGDGELEFEPDDARKLLAEAGYPEGKGFPVLRLLYNTDENHKRIAEMAQQMWKKHLGIQVDLVNQEWKVYLKSMQEVDYDICRSGWIGDYLDPMTFLDMWTTGNGNNNTHWSDREYDGLIEKARHEPDPKKRLEILTKAETILLTRGPVMPIYHYARQYLLNPAVEGFHKHPIDLHPIRYISKK